MSCTDSGSDCSCADRSLVAGEASSSCNMACRAEPVCTRSKACWKPRKLAALCTPLCCKAASKCARSKGNKPLPATTPSMTALTSVPLARAISPKSHSCASCAKVCTNCSSDALSQRPSPKGMRSWVVSARAVELNTRVRSGDTRPSAACLAVSSNSEDSKASSAPGTGLRLNTGGADKADKGVGNTSM